MNDDVPSGDPTRIPALDEASRTGDLQKAIDILNSLDHSYVSQDLQFSLYLAFAYGHLHVARYLLDRGATVGRLVANGAIHSEPELDLIEVFEMMLEHGWDVNGEVRMSCTALCCPPVLKNHAAVKWLLDHGANPNMGPSVVFQTGPGVVPDSGIALQLAACWSSISTFDLLLEHGAKLENSFPLHDAAGGGSDERIPMMAHLIKLGVDVNGSDIARVRFRHGTPLHCAVISRHPGTIRFLLENGADPHIADVYGVTPLEAAKRLGNQEIITLLSTKLPH